MNPNPFTSETFERIWSKFYCKGKTIYKFDAIKGVKFTKSNSYPIYSNLGKNLTNGMDYILDANAKDFKRKVAIIYDVPSYIDIPNQIPQGLSLKKITQYDGRYNDLQDFNSMDDVLKEHFNSSKSRYNFRRSLKILEETAKTTYKVYFGDISKEDYEREMNRFEELLGKRFDDKNEFNTILPMWDFYKELIYPMILDKQVAMNVVYDDEKPIGMSINFLNNDTLIVAIRTFDIDYYKMNIGNIEIYKLLEWCLENGIKKLDFSKGESDYKLRWTNTGYVYEHHIIYDSTSAFAAMLGNSVAKFFQFKQYLRTKNVNSFYVKLKHFKRKILFQK